MLNDFIIRPHVQFGAEWGILKIADTSGSPVFPVLVPALAASYKIWDSLNLGIEGRMGIIFTSTVTTNFTLALHMNAYSW